MAHRMPPAAPRPTQVARPWRATVRSSAVLLLALLPALPEIADAANIDTVPFVVTLLAIAAAIHRVILIPEVDRELARHGLGSADRKDYYHE